MEKEENKINWLRNVTPPSEKKHIQGLDQILNDRLCVSRVKKKKEREREFLIYTQSNMGVNKDNKVEEVLYISKRTEAFILSLHWVKDIV